MKEKIRLLFLIVLSAVVGIAGLYFVFGYSPGDLGNLINNRQVGEEQTTPTVSVAAKGWYRSPAILKYPDRDNQERNTYAVPGYITIIAKDNAAPDAIRALVKKIAGTIYAEIPDSGLYFTEGFLGREYSAVMVLYGNNDIVDYAFPTPVSAAKGVWTIEDYLTKVTSEDGNYLHVSDDGTISWTQDAEGSVTHGQLVAWLAGATGKNDGTINAAFTVKDKDGNDVNYMDVGSGLSYMADVAQDDRERGETTVVNNSWGAVLDVSQSASATDYRQAADAVLEGEFNNYLTLLNFLDGNPNAIVVKAAGNEGLDISGVMTSAQNLAGDEWNRLVVVGALDSNLNPTAYSNRAVGRTDILWVPELVTKDGSPVPGTSFTTPQISYLLNRVVRERPDLRPDQLVSILFDYRVSPRVNLRPTIMDPLSDDTFKTAMEVAAERFPPPKITKKPPDTKKQDERGAKMTAGGRWVSAVPGKGMRIWEAISEGRGWYEWDVDLRFEGSTGSIANTLITVAPVLLEDPYYRDSIRGQIGVKSVAPIKNLKDDGTTIDFNVGNATFQLTRTPDGHLKGRYHVPKGEEGNAGWLEWEGTLDLVPSPR